MRVGGLCGGPPAGRIRKPWTGRFEFSRPTGVLARWAVVRYGGIRVRSFARHSTAWWEGRSFWDYDFFTPNFERQAVHAVPHSLTASLKRIAVGVFFSIRLWVESR